MSYKDDNAIQRIFKTFGRLKDKIFKEDIDALKQVNDSLEFYKMNMVNDNKIYSKILAILIKEKYLKYQDANETLKHIESDLKQSLDYHLELLSNSIRVNELCSYINTLTIDVPHSEFNDVDALTKRENEFWDVHQKKIFSEINKMWSVENVKDKFYNSANEFLRDVENYK